MSRKSATVLALADYRTKHRTLYFTRHELNQLLSLYSRHVARGVWRDYAIEHQDGRALFSVFRHTHKEAARQPAAQATCARSPALPSRPARASLRRASTSMIGIASSAMANPGQENASPAPRHKLQPAATTT